MGSLFLALVVALGLGGVAPGTDLKDVHDPVEVVRCDSLTVYYPRFRRMDLATGSMPQKSDSTVIFCCAAAFTGEKLTTFKHSNIAGHHVSGGTFYEGFHCGPNNGVFTWTPTGGWNYFNFSHKNSRPPLAITMLTPLSGDSAITCSPGTFSISSCLISECLLCGM